MIDIPNITPVFANNEIRAWDPKTNHIPRSILILGNGFDLGLGICTSYKNFANNKDYWPFDRTLTFEEDSLPYFLNESIDQVNTWFDLEELLASYASKDTELSEDKISKAKEDFLRLTNALMLYLEKQEDLFVQHMNSAINGHARRMQPAHYLLNYFLRKPIRSIYTFNYTNAYRIARQLILNFDDSIKHVHGSIRDGNIILGTGDQRNLKDEFFEFHKSASPIFQSNNLVEDLNDSDEVYIFGHSLGKNDHDYFSDFFKTACKSVHRPFAPGKIKVRIFTYDDQSEIAIKKELMTLTEKHLVGLYAHCDFKILKTDLKHQTEWMMNEDML